MSEWCLLHPWMTFFIAMTIAGGIGSLIRVVVVKVKQ